MHPEHHHPDEHHANEPVEAADQKSGLAYWAARVLEECDKASHDFAADPVHDLRVAIRRCRSMADGFLSVDPDSAWRQMKKLGKGLFASLGDLRDVIRAAEPADKAAIYDQLGLRVTLQPGQDKTRAEV